MPGAGPYASPHLAFTHALRGGPWWQRVETAVRPAGALLDIFPSLHTGLSVLVGLHAYRYRRQLPMRWTWLPTWFFVANIVVATVFLRWHYGIDLIAGTALAFGAQHCAIRRWQYEGNRELHGPEHAVWELALPAELMRMEPQDRRLFLGVALLLVGAIALGLAASALRLV